MRSVCSLLRSASSRSARRLGDTPGVAGHSAAKDFVHIYERGWAKRGNPMIDHEAPLAFSFGAILRIGIPVSILWIIGDAIDGGSQSFIGVPLLIAAWLGAFVALDRWVSGRQSSSQRSGRRSGTK